MRVFGASGRNALLLIGALLVCGGAAHAQDVDSCLRLYGQSLDVLATIQFRCTVKTYLTVTGGARDELIREDLIFCRRDQGRWKIEHLKARSRDSRRQWREAQWDLVVTGDGSIRGQVAPDSKGNPRLLVTASGSKAVRRPLDHLREVQILFGQLADDDDKPLAEVILSGKNSARNVQLDGRPVVLVEADNAYGAQQVWFDPARNYWPVKMILTKRADDLEFGKPLATVNYDVVGYPPGVRKEIVRDFGNVTFTRFGERDMISGFTYTEGQSFLDGAAATTRSAVALEQFAYPDVNAADAFRLTMKIPDGTPVSMQDDPQVNYVWKNGAPVKRIEEAALKPFDSVTFVNSKGGWLRVITMAVCGIACVCLAIWLVRRRMAGA